MSRGQDEELGDEFCAAASVYPLIHEIRVDIVAHIDTPLTYDQLVAPDSTYTIIRPLCDKYLALRNPSVVFCLLLNKVQFVTDSHQISIATLSVSRAKLCEILAVRVLRGWSERSLALATVLLTPWPLFRGAPEDVIRGAKEDGEEEALDDSGTALEMAIISQSKAFIRSPSCQKVIEGIWSGKIVYTSLNTHALIQDNYKKRPIQIYNPHKAPFLDHYRLKVPKYRAILEYANFVILFLLYCLTIERLDPGYINMYEAVFIVYALAFSLDKLAAIREHGLKVFASSMVNGFDLGFVFIFVIYLGARVLGSMWHNPNALEFGTDLLAIGAVLMFPRLVFMTLANNLMVLSIRSMLTEFFFLMSVGIFCFLGFVYALRTLNQSIGVNQICWWLLEVFFGLDATGFEQAHEFHPYLGPILMATYGFLSNTLLTVVCVAVLGNTFSAINADASAESMFRKAVATIEGVKADMVFSYQLPFNLLALVVLYPLSFVLNARWFHKVNVFMIRLTNLPVLLAIAVYDRQKFNNDPSWWEQLCDFTDHYLGRLSIATEGLVGARMDISAVFELEREYGEFYKSWELDEDVFDDDECDDECDEEENIALDAGLVSGNGGTITLSPSEETFPSLVGHPAHLQRQPSHSSPHHPRHERRRSFGGSQLSQSMSTAPLPRVRRNSGVLNGPSPLARIYTRDDVPIRRSTVGVGSLPVTSTLSHMSSSPRRATKSNGLRDSTASNASAMSTSLSVSSFNSGDGRPWKSSFQRPGVAPIQEVSTPVLTPKQGDGLERPELARRGASVPFPEGSDDSEAKPDRGPRIKFGELPSAHLLRRASMPGPSDLHVEHDEDEPSPAAQPTPSPTPSAKHARVPDYDMSPRSTSPVAGTSISVTKSPATSTPVTKTPAAKSTATKSPATKSPATKSPATKSPAAGTPTTSSPALGAGSEGKIGGSSKTAPTPPSPASSLALIPFPKKVVRPPGPGPTRSGSTTQSSPTVPRASGTSSSRPLPAPSPHLKPQAPSGKQPKTASELLESMESHNQHNEHRIDARSVEAQLAAVEARQQRIEDLLERLLHCTASERGVDITPRRRGQDHDTFDDDF
ncbi:hypothetical protein CC85DRAFT_299674 [Cutaneotrichosporon oleaginosum]|uniref:Ion transport domain-containing protein n=1 Tax=Cutaneotrichosporon oleaginosum TaxID=879819 RepID=A0A0J0XVZ2_9TREE|nr:uncharacterized protein CC85DRAFT_299674 [Cutaneotrichosporon oleaginosum]KLT45208.1 hypothetical protein CC85DRAFT_299674 [Cutaneotrichosporon oleaginosum]TXT14956.1 hypothetical protein COLE_01149 [Cutaneotrichosporon oleaginosum]